MAAKREEEEPAAPSGGDDAPDWTTWLRSRLERVSNSERKAADSGQDVPEEVAGGDPPKPEGPVPQGNAAPKTAPAPPAPAPAPAPGSARPAPTPVPVRPAAAASTSGSEVDALRAAVTALVAGVGALADTFSGFRTTVTERLDEYRETLLRATTDTATELEAHRQVHAGAATDEPNAALAEVNDRLQRLAAGMDHLTTIRGDDERWAEVMGRLLDEVDAERQASEQERSVTGGVIERLEGLEQAMQGIATDVAENVAGQQRIAAELAELAELAAAYPGFTAEWAQFVEGQERLASYVAQMAQAQQGVTAEMAQVAEGQQRIAEDVAELAQAQQRQADEVTQMALAQRASAEAEAVLEGAVRDAAIEQRPLPPVRPPASSGRRRAPLRAERQAPRPGRSR